MKFHIIRSNESLEEIMFLYNISKEELMGNNRHIKVWDKLIPGTKLKIPSITEADDLEINQMEPFIEDYYPKLETYDYHDVSQVEKPGEVKENPVELKEEVAKEKLEESYEENKPTIPNPYPFYPYYGFYRYPYYPIYYYKEEEED